MTQRQISFRQAWCHLIRRRPSKNMRRSVPTRAKHHQSTMIWRKQHPRKVSRESLMGTVQFVLRNSIACLPFFTTEKVSLISVITSRHVGWRLCSTSRNDQLFLICHMPGGWRALFSTTHWCLHSDVKSSSGALIVVVQNALFISTSHCHRESESQMCSKQNYDHFEWVTTREDLSKQIKVSILNYPLRRNVKLINISARWNPDSPGNGNESERKINWFE